MLCFCFSFITKPKIDGFVNVCISELVTTATFLTTRHTFLTTHARCVAKVTRLFRRNPALSLPGSPFNLGPKSKPAMPKCLFLFLTQGPFLELRATMSAAERKRQSKSRWRNAGISESSALAPNPRSLATQQGVQDTSSVNCFETPMTMS